MDRALWLLLWLRSRAWCRRAARDLRTLKGALLVLVGASLFLPMGIAAFLVPHMELGQASLLRRFGALGMFGYCVFYVLLASGDRVVAYSPAEVNFLFAGPFRPRQLLLYKVARSFGDSVLGSFFLMFLVAHHAASFLAAYLGLLLGMEFMFLFALAVSLLTRTVAVLVDNRLRRVVLVGLMLLAAAQLWQLGGEAFRLAPLELLRRLEHSPVVRAVLWPFRPFPMVFTSERLWPDLARWAGLGLALDLALLGLVQALDARYLEASATASARLYARLGRLKRGDWSEAGKARFGVPGPPWWGGVGPNFWRQLTTAARGANRLVALLILYLFPMLLLVYTIRATKPDADVGIPVLSTWVALVLIAPAMIGLDFRSDLDRMEVLKTLPIAPRRLVLGQVLAPVAILTAAQWLALAVLTRLARVEPLVLGGTAALVVPFNLLLVAIENLFFLWFPTRLASGNAADFQGMGRQLLLMTAKLAAAGLGAAIAAGFGLGAFFLAGESWTAALAAAWGTLLGVALGLVPLLALAFGEFDIAHDVPD